MLDIKNVDLPLFPKITHMQGSGLPEVFEGRMSFARLDGQLSIEEMLDGREVSVGFKGNNGLLLRLGNKTHDATANLDPDALLIWQYLSSFKTDLYDVLSNRYTLHGQWLYTKHYLFYDQLPTYFLVLDVFDTTLQRYLLTLERKDICDQVPILQAPILWSGNAQDCPNPQTLLKRSLYQSKSWRENLNKAIKDDNLPNAKVWQATDMKDTAMGLCLRTENDQQITGRYKHVRANFIRGTMDAPHWGWQGIKNNLA